MMGIEKITRDKADEIANDYNRENYGVTLYTPITKHAVEYVAHRLGVSVVATNKSDSLYADIRKYLRRCGYENVIDYVKVDGGRYAALLPYSFGRVRIIVGSLDSTWGYDQQIEFDDLENARRVLVSIGGRNDGIQRQ